MHRFAFTFMDDGNKCPFPCRGGSTSKEPGLKNFGKGNRLASWQSQIYDTQPASFACNVLVTPTRKSETAIHSTKIGRGLATVDLVYALPLMKKKSSFIRKKGYCIFSECCS